MSAFGVPGTISRFGEIGGSGRSRWRQVPGIVVLPVHLPLTLWLSALGCSTAWILGRTPPCAVVKLPGSLLSSWSLRSASCRGRPGVLLPCFPRPDSLAGGRVIIVISRSAERVIQDCVFPTLSFPSGLQRLLRANRDVPVHSRAWAPEKVPIRGIAMLSLVYSVRQLKTLLFSPS